VSYDVTPTIMECPRCGRLWVGVFRSHATGSLRNRQDVVFSFKDEDEMVRSPHRIAGFSRPGAQGWGCYGTPERVQHPAAEAAFILGGRAAAEALWPEKRLAKAVLAYEALTRG
jgi:hypothetical protein